MNEAELAERIAARMSRALKDLDPKITARLRTARTDALMSHRAPQRAPRLAGATAHIPPHGWNLLADHRLRVSLAALIFAVLTLTTWRSTQVAPPSAGDIDARLLSSDLPLQAYVDNTFAKWINASSDN
ncbi:MAG: DUF3619 family protein [Betaproteobacteria bacterium]|nr:DUF3619 family protein [Betaproteobacteria bacterium]